MKTNIVIKDTNMSPEEVLADLHSIGFIHHRIQICYSFVRDICVGNLFCIDDHTKINTGGGVRRSPSPTWARWTLTETQWKKFILRMRNEQARNRQESETVATRTRPYVTSSVPSMSRWEITREDAERIVQRYRPMVSMLSE